MVSALSSNSKPKVYPRKFENEKIYALEFFLFVILIILYLFIQVFCSLEYSKLVVQWKLIEAPMGVSLHKYSVMQHSLPMT